MLKACDLPLVTLATMQVASRSSVPKIYGTTKATAAFSLGSVQNITATCADAPVKKAPKIIGAEALIPPAPNLEVKKGCSAVKGMLANLETARIAAVKAKQAELIGI